MALIPKVRLISMDLIPRELSFKMMSPWSGLKSKGIETPWSGSGLSLHVDGVFETEKGGRENVSGYISDELAVKLLDHLRQEKPMKLGRFLNSFFKNIVGGKDIEKYEGKYGIPKIHPKEEKCCSKGQARNDEVK